MAQTPWQARIFLTFNVNRSTCRYNIGVHQECLYTANVDGTHVLVCVTEEHPFYTCSLLHNRILNMTI